MCGPGHASPIATTCSRKAGSCGRAARASWRRIDSCSSAISARVRPTYTFSMKRENIVGRANVEDTPELEAYYRSLEGEARGALWTVANEIEPWYPQPKSVRTLWKWRNVERFVRRAPQLVSAEKGARRVVMVDPKRVV